MKKIIVASFQCESNSKAKLHPTKEDFEYFKGEEIFKKLAVKDIFENAGFEDVRQDNMAYYSLSGYSF